MSVLPMDRSIAKTSTSKLNDGHRILYTLRRQIERKEYASELNSRTFMYTCNNKTSTVRK